MGKQHNCPVKKIKKEGKKSKDTRSSKKEMPTSKNSNADGDYGACRNSEAYGIHCSQGIFGVSTGKYTASL